MTRNKTLLYVSLLILLFVLSTCSSEKKDREGERSDFITLTYWSSSNQQEIQLAEELVEKWNASHDSVKIHLQPIPASQSSEEVLLAAIAGGTTPDVCSNMWPGAMDDFISAGGLVQLDQYQDFLPTISQRVPDDLLHSFRAPDGHYYQIPWKTNPIMMMYNVGLFREAGIERPPATYSEYLQAAEKVTRDIDGDGVIDVWMGFRDVRPIWWQRLFDYFPFYIAASGGRTLFKNGEIDFDNSASVKVFQFFRELYRLNYYPKTTFQGDAFIQGKIATQFTGPWNIAHVEKFKTPDFEYDIAPLPVPDDFHGIAYTYGDHKNISIFSTTKYPRQAYEFAMYLISRESDLRLLEICTQIPIRKDIVNDPLFSGYFRTHPRMVSFARQAPFTRGVDGVSDLKEIFDAISQEYEACALYGAKSPEEAVHSAARRAGVIREWNRR